MISIIVPIYKVEDYLVSCINSILASTFQDFEIILVDDGSPDRCGEICDGFAAKDSRIKVIHQLNGGLSAARNSGLRIASGDYIAFVDSDDVIHPRMLEVLYDAITSGDYDFSMIYYVMVQDKGIGYDYVSDAGVVDTHSSRIISQGEYYNNLASQADEAYHFHVSTNKLYKRSLVNGHLFRNLASEDVEWQTRICNDARQGILVEAEMYYYIQREGSIIHANDRRLDRTSTYYECFKDIPSDYSSYRAAMLKEVYSMLFGCRHLYRHSPKLDEVNALAAKVYDETKTELLHSQLSLLRKLRIMCFYHFPRLYTLLLKLRYGGLF